MKSKINYRSLYLDFISRAEYIPIETKNILKEKIRYENTNDISFKTLTVINRIIKEHKTAGQKRKSQSKNAYDKSFIQYILNYQREQNLNNSELSKKFNLSRNTVISWKKKRFI